MRKVVCNIVPLMAQSGIRTIQELHEKTGITRKTLSKLVNKESAMIKHETIIKLCKLFDCEISDLLYLVDEETYQKQQSAKEERETKKKKGYVYFVKDPEINLIKIGRSRDFDKRFYSLNKEFNENLEVIHKIYTDDCFELEKKFHEHFDKYRFSGEWFKLTTKDMDFVKKEFN